MLTMSFDDPRAVDARVTGGKGCGLAVMAQAGIPVAPGFTVSTEAYRAYLGASGLAQRLRQLLAEVDRDSLEALEAAARTATGWFEAVPLPQVLRAALESGYRALCDGQGTADLSVAVRSSATAEDSAGASFAGEYDTFVGIRGCADVDLHLRRCWASAFSPRALCYAWKNGIDPLGVEMAIVVQLTVDARAAGVMFTVSPLTGDRSRIAIEAAWGLGLGVVGGDVTPDRYLVAKVEGTILDRILGSKHIEYLGCHLATPVEPERQAQFCLHDEEVLALARLGKRLERLHGAPQDIEFAIARGLAPGENVVLLQCRPITVLPTRAVSATDAALASLAASVMAAARPA